MGILQRDYMGESYEKKQASKKYWQKKDRLRNELFALYGKQSKSILDRYKIRRIENELRKMSQNQPS